MENNFESEYEKLLSFTEDSLNFYRKFFGLYIKKNEILATEWSEHLRITDRFHDFTEIIK